MANADANRISMHLRKGTPERQKRLAAAAAASVTVDTAAVVDNDRKSNNGHNSRGGQRRSKTPTRPTQGPPRFPKAKPLEPGSPRPSRRTDWLEQHHQARGIILHTVPTRQAKLRQQTPGPGTAQQQDVVADDPVLLKVRRLCSTDRIHECLAVQSDLCTPYRFSEAERASRQSTRAQQQRV